MKLLLMSDTHGEAAQAVRIVQKHPDVDYRFHMGDVGFEPALLKDVWIVCGNHDEQAYPMQYILDLCGYRTLILHGHQFEYALMQRMKIDKDIWRSWDFCMEVIYEEMVRYAKSHQLQMILFGHTHTAYFAQREGICLCNPGSLCFSHDGRLPSYAIMNIEDRVETEFHFLDDEDK